MKDEGAVKNNLLYAGCREQTADIVEQLYLAGRLSDALHEMKAFRCDLMEALHQSQRRVDCLDYLIRQTEKEIIVKQNQQHWIRKTESATLDQKNRTGKTESV